METIYDRIKNICDMKDMPISELERKADLGGGTIRRWSNSVPSADKLQRTAKILGVSMAYLLNGTTDEDEIDKKALVFAREVNELTDEQLDLIYNMIDHFRKENKLD